MIDLSFPEIPHLLNQDLTSDESQLQILQLYLSFQDIVKPMDWLLIAFIFLTIIILFQNKQGDTNFIKISYFLRYLMLLISISLLVLSYATISFYKQDNFILLKKYLNVNGITYSQKDFIPDSYEGIDTIFITKDSKIDLLNFLNQPIVNKHIIIDANKFIDTDFLGVKVEKHANKSVDVLNLTKMFLENEQYPAYFSFNVENHLVDSNGLSYTWANNNDSTHILQIPYNLGLITILSDTEIWENHKIQTYDNAWLSWYLFKNSRVTILNPDEFFIVSLEPYRYFFVFLSLFFIMIYHLSRQSTVINHQEKLYHFNQTKKSILKLINNKKNIDFDPKRDDFVSKSNQLLDIWKNK